MAERLIERARALPVPHVAMLLRDDFDSAITRRRLFGDNLMFSAKVTLLGAIKWFDGPSSPSNNHSWFLFDRKHRGKNTYICCAMDAEATARIMFILAALSHGEAGP
jgi:hypothetical protein